MVGQQQAELESRLPSDDSAPAIARGEALRFGRRAGLTPGELASLRLLVSELVTNAIRHGHAEAPVDLRLDLRDERIRVEVRDHGAGFRQPAQTPAPGNDGGYGLLIVEELCADWGVEQRDGALVWGELPRRVPLYA